MCCHMASSRPSPTSCERLTSLCTRQTTNTITTTACCSTEREGMVVEGKNAGREFLVWKQEHKSQGRGAGRKGDTHSWKAPRPVQVPQQQQEPRAIPKELMRGAAPWMQGGNNCLRYPWLCSGSHPAQPSALRALNAHPGCTGIVLPATAVKTCSSLWPWD